MTPFRGPSPDFMSINVKCPRYSNKNAATIAICRFSQRTPGHAANVPKQEYLLKIGPAKHEGPAQRVDTAATLAFSASLYI